MNKKIISIIIVIIIIITLALIGIWIVSQNEKKENGNLIENISNNENNLNENNLIINQDFEFEIKEDFDIEKLKSYKLPIIINFGADYCKACKRMEPDLKELNSELQGKAIIRTIDKEKYPEFAEGYPIKSIPTQVFINSDGTPYAPENSSELEYITDENGKHILTIHAGVLTLDEMKDILKEMGLNE